MVTIPASLRIDTDTGDTFTDRITVSQRGGVDFGSPNAFDVTTDWHNNGQCRRHAQGRPGPYLL